jgi:hypothetical protein
MTFGMYKSSAWYKPYFVNNFELKKIHFFNKNGVVLSIGSGWFEGIDHDLNMPFSLVIKRKPDFSLTSAFLIPIKREYYEKDGRKAELYLPYDVFEWETKKDNRHHDGATVRAWYDTIMNKTLGFSHDIFSRDEPLKDNVKYLEAVKPVFEIINKDVNEYALIADRDKIIEAMRKAMDKLEPNVKVNFT